MHLRPLLAAVLISVSLACPSAWGQAPQTKAAPPKATDTKAADTKPADAKPAESKAPASKEQAEFDKLLGQWNGLIERLQKLQTQFKKVKPSERKPVRAEFAKLLKEGDELQSKLLGAAEAAYRVAPNKSQDVNDLLTSIVTEDENDDYYEQLLPIAKLLIENKFDNPRIYNSAGKAAYQLNDYDLAEKYLKTAEKDGTIDDDSRRLLEQLPESKAKWAKEKVLREREAHADKAHELPRVELKTSKGPIVIELFEDQAPNTVANFISLVEKGFYNGLTFHRVIPHFMAQGGDPKGTGAGGPGYTIECECYRPDHRDHFRGTLSMAHAGKDTGGSQFFLTFVRTPNLDGMHTAFGRVISGFDTLAKLQRRNPEEPNQPPPDKILAAVVLRKRDHKYEPVKGPDR
ncbi:MAG TPA: peptidylprolyl isomerase [Pirellulales bacterium]|jgi:cyclophilin family peptidyl-prolyl cis-trans isomerase|nr:peptidylprolyl isomerase [Pirellulales bacterium]